MFLNNSFRNIFYFFSQNLKIIEVGDSYCTLVYYINGFLAKTSELILVHDTFSRKSSDFQ